MAAFAHTRRIALRPHAKTHKSARIAQSQLAAGAIGIACATVIEGTVYLAAYAVVLDQRKGTERRSRALASQLSSESSIRNYHTANAHDQAESEPEQHPDVPKRSSIEEKAEVPAMKAVV